MAAGKKGKELEKLAPCTLAACYCSQLDATSSRQHVPKVAELWDNFQLIIVDCHLRLCSSINRPCCAQKSGRPEFRVRAQETLYTTAFLVHQVLQKIELLPTAV
ncbi:MAG: hypothetical protein AB2693_27620 [Candidatus Thiodiazotropha sp.]